MGSLRVECVLRPNPHQLERYCVAEVICCKDQSSRPPRFEPNSFALFRLLPSPFLSRFLFPFPRLDRCEREWA